MVSSSLLVFTVILADEDKATLTRVERLSIAAAVLWVPLMLAALMMPSQAGEIALFVAAWVVMVPLGAVAAKLHREVRFWTAFLDDPNAPMV